VVTEQVRTLLRGSKDAALAFGARTYINNRLRGIGKMTEFSIDTRAHAFRVGVKLLGETTPVEIHVKEYVLRRTTSAATLTIVEATASRRWLSAALSRFVVGRHLTIPAQAGAALKLLT
jgi:hypothetical protein